MRSRDENGESPPRVARAIIPRAMTFDFFSRRIFLEYTSPDTRGIGGRGEGRKESAGGAERRAGCLAASEAAAKGWYP